ncbi:MAG: fimbria/pilus periplasmic chaperone [Proteobacteria bacterium]|nr:fimbria/pilus periplasmic chaperone [Pseudomonadota bacterium]
MKIKISYKYLLLSVFFSVNAGFAQVTVDSMFHQFKYDDSPVKNVTVLNSDTLNSISVEVESFKVLNPGTKEEKLVAEDALIVTPKKFSIDKSGQRTVRLLLRKKAESTQEVYRVNFVPKAESAEDDESNDESKKKNNKAFKLALLTGTGILVFSEPSAPNPEISWETQGQNFILKNTGNQSLLLENFFNCELNEEGCTNNVVTKRIYPGRDLSIARLAKPLTKAYFILYNENKELIVKEASGKSDW